ncbi:MAG: hypothetical protein KJN95_04575, partial [Gammaproteobacteria bacterium]|nr:hypothetical protein [Gammaproteobacteria bacterium]
MFQVFGKQILFPSTSVYPDRQRYLQSGDNSTQKPVHAAGAITMSSTSEDQNLAIFCDFENVALG